MHICIIYVRMCACSTRPLEMPKGTMLPPTLHGGTAHNVPFTYVAVPLVGVPLEGVMQDIARHRCVLFLIKCSHF